MIRRYHCRYLLVPEVVGRCLRSFFVDFYAILGKTRVLTTRIAHLIEHHGVPSDAIVAVTFTNKAANEMRERLKKLVGREKTMTLQMGPFNLI